MFKGIDLKEAEQKLEKLVQIEDKRIRRFDEAVARLNEDFDWFYDGIDEIDGNKPNEQVARDLLLRIRKLKKELEKLNNLFASRRKITYPMLILMNTSLSLTAQDTFIRFFFDPYSDDPRSDNYIDVKKILDNFFAVDAYNILLNASRNRDRRLAYSHERRKQRIKSHEINADVEDTREKSTKILPILEWIVTEYGNEKHLTDSDDKFTIRLTPPGERSSSWDGRTGIMELGSDSFHYYKEERSRSGYRCSLWEVIGFLIHESIVHRIHEIKSESMSKSTKAGDANHSNLVSMAPTEGKTFFYTEDVLKYLEGNIDKINKRFRSEFGIVDGLRLYKIDLQLIKDWIRLYPKEQAYDLILHTELMKEPLREVEKNARTKLSLRKKSRRNTEEIHLSETHCHLKNKEYEGDRYSEAIRNGAYQIGKRYIYGEYSRLNREYGEKIVADNKPIFDYVEMMGAWAIPVNPLWTDLALSTLGFKKRKR